MERFTAFNIIPTTLQNVQLQVKLLPGIQEKALFKKIMEAACPQTGVCDYVIRGSTASLSEKVGIYAVIEFIILLGQNIRSIILLYPVQLVQ